MRSISKVEATPTEEGITLSTMSGMLMASSRAARSIQLLSCVTLESVVPVDAVLAAVSEEDALSLLLL